MTSGVVSGITKIARLGVELSREGERRLRWFDYYESHGRNASLTCRHFDISGQTFYRWKRRYDKSWLGSLEGRSHRPHRVRRPMYTVELVEAVVGLREQYPRWGKDKLVVLLKTTGYETSSSTVGRILTYARKRGILVEPTVTPVSAGKRARRRPYAVRKPKEYQANRCGDIVQLDTLDLRPLPGVNLKHFTAHDVRSKWNVVDVYSRATATTATRFLDTVEARMPFAVRAIQVDGGSEFQAVFEEVCQRRGIKLFVLPPRSPKLNGGVERAHRTHTEEFYEVTNNSFELDDLRRGLLAWETTYNRIRPHQSLGYLTPYQFLRLNSKGGQLSPIT